MFWQHSFKTQPIFPWWESWREWKRFLPEIKPHNHFIIITVLIRRQNKSLNRSLFLFNVFYKMRTMVLKWGQNALCHCQTQLQQQIMKTSIPLNQLRFSSDLFPRSHSPAASALNASRSGLVSISVSPICCASLALRGAIFWKMRPSQN